MIIKYENGMFCRGFIEKLLDNDKAKVCVIIIIIIIIIVIIIDFVIIIYDYVSIHVLYI